MSAISSAISRFWNHLRDRRYVEREQRYAIEDSRVGDLVEEAREGGKVRPPL